MFQGSYPALYDTAREVEPTRWLEDDLTTFINRDVRQIVEVRNRTAFDHFVRLCAARTGQVFHAISLADECGVKHMTIKSWTSVMEACYLIRFLRPYSRNFGKRLVKAPKLYFIDSGLACRLLNIANADQLKLHQLWGALVETWCVGDAIKARLNRGLSPSAWSWRSSDGTEIDLLFETGAGLVPMEVKAAVPPRREFTRSIEKFRDLSEREPAVSVLPGAVIYGGDAPRPSGQDRLLPWDTIESAVPLF